VFLMADVREYEKQYEEQKHQAIENLPSNCAFLGIEYTPEREQEVWAITEAVEIKDACLHCQYTVDNCYKCKHIRYAGFKPYTEECVKFKKYIARNEIQEYLKVSGMGKRFLDKTFENFEVTEPTQKAFNACMTFCKEYLLDNGIRGIKLFGNYGCGKTHLMSAVIHKLAEYHKAAFFVVVPDLLKEIRQGFGQGGYSSELIKKVEIAPILILDDLGAEKSSEWVREQLYVIINQRYINMLPTLVTTNCTTEELMERLGERTVSRLIEMTDSYKITADDYRLKK